MYIIRSILLSVFLFAQLSSSYAGTLDSLITQLESVTSQEKSSEIYLEIGDHYYLKDEYDQALENYEKGLVGNDNEQNEQTYLKLLSGAGKANRRLSNYDISLDYFSRILSIADSTSVYYSERADAHNHIGLIHKSLGDYQKAYQYILNALNIHTLEKDSAGIGRDYYSLGSIFFYQKRYDQSLEYFKKAKDLFIATGDERWIFKSYSALGVNYGNLDQWDESYEFGNKAFKLASKLDYKLGMAYSLGNLAEVHLKNNEFLEAKKMLTEALRLKEELKDNWGVIGAHLSIIGAYLKCKEPAKALPHLKIAEDLSEKIGSKSRLMATYQAYELTYEALGKYTEAYIYLKKYTVFRDSVHNEKTLEDMDLAKKKFELEKKESEIALLKSENELLGQRKKTQQLQSYFILFVAFGLFLSFWFVKSRLNLQRKTNALLEEKNEKIEYQNAALHETQKQLVEVNALLEKNNAILGAKNEEIAFKNKQLKNSNEDLENFAYVASHDLKEPLRMINSYTALLKRKYNDMFDENGKEFMYFVTDAAKRMNVLLDDLLNYSRVGKTGTMDNMINVNDVLLIVESNLSKRLEEEKGVIQVNSQSIPTILSNHTQLVQLFQNIISNALKFRGERDPIVTIDCQLKDGQHVFSIQDNGIGIAEEHQSRVFEMFKRLHTREEYEGTGIGLSTCKKIVQKHGGDIWLESTLNEGTTFYFAIPKKTNIPAPVMN